MKGMIFTEFLEMVEGQFSPEVADRIIEARHLPSGGAYTAVGTYDQNEMVQLATWLSKESGIAIPTLLHLFGMHLFARFVANYPQFFDGIESAFDFLQEIAVPSMSKCGSCIPMPSSPALSAFQSQDS